MRLGGSRVGIVVLLVVALAATPGAEAAPIAPKKPIHVMFVGDSIPASLFYVSSARGKLERGIDVDFDLRVCRRLATTGCSYQGTIPTSALESVLGAGAGIGEVLVIDVGYNESAGGYADGMARVVRAARTQGVRTILWLTLKETSDIYRETNAVIHTEAKRWPFVHVVDWNARSAGRPWFREDDLHLNPAGAEGLATMLRPYILRSARTDE